MEKLRKAFFIMTLIFGSIYLISSILLVLVALNMNQMKKSLDDQKKPNLISVFRDTINVHVSPPKEFYDTFYINGSLTGNYLMLSRPKTDKTILLTIVNNGELFINSIESDNSLQTFFQNIQAVLDHPNSENRYIFGILRNGVIQSSNGIFGERKNHALLYIYKYKSEVLAYRINQQDLNRMIRNYKDSHVPN